MKIINFDISHIDLINLKLKYSDLNTLKAETYCYEDSQDEGKTYTYDDKIIFSCGVKIFRKGVAHCWVIPSIYVDKHKKFFYKEIKNVLHDYCQRHKIHRMQSTIDEPFIKWIECLGFHQESILEKITQDKKDQFMYVKFFE